MKVVSFVRNGKSSYGVVSGPESDRGIVDLGARLGSKYPDLVAVLKAGAPAEVAAAAPAARTGGPAPDMKLAGTTLLPEAPKPGTYVCAGLNSADHPLETCRQPH